MGLSRDRAAKLEERLDFETSGAPATVHENPGEIVSEQVVPTTASGLQG